ncbi:hypothetical protein [Bradyrhizobium erythrophlei]|uniref:Uncharacterized protein n=1 Tax=Bradyrhizobium erythrophlei TaxID=1437360 RepID=A0A1M5NJS9_9BRAD|nr:hypothetical protein [Bradyrhizobium erythrophlei]SHG89854.1 hypothetical protein SAMN05443248_3025 [Bradyrhizobium erythrophlei]
MPYENPPPADLALQLDEIDRLIDDLRFKQFETLLKLAENQIKRGVDPLEAIGRVRKTLRTLSNFS